MHPSLTLTFIVFVAGYITAQFSLISRAFELLVFAWENGAFGRALKAAAILTFIYFIILIPLERIAARETRLHSRASSGGISAREQLRRRGSF
ncbi:phosphatidylinositol N-acetylglucosaminyltransferase subunit gpi1 [Orbilia ellipsospora]|uniref:Phosphatidylinositol N-acetylglucosaminyltransferase subunit gpi1 n=1 Tax=Orbilia ellipsospora TaxID=2528407 RepID=A0AAV9XNM5_9PEZI